MRGTSRNPRNPAAPNGGDGVGVPDGRAGNASNRAGRTPRSPGARPFIAAVLSLVWPGLGQVYAGHPRRALAWAVPPAIGLAVLAGTLIDLQTRQWLVADLFSPVTLQVVLALDGIVLAYRVLAVIDAYRLAASPGAAGRGRGGWLTARPVTAASLLAVLLVLSLGHVALARYDRIAYDTIAAITGPDLGVTPAATPSESSSARASTSPTGRPSPAAASATPATPAPPQVRWNGTERLNVLLVGSDQRPGDATFNTDTMIVASIDPTTGQVSMFSVPRDTENVPLPAAWPAHSFFTGGVFPDRINSLWTYAQHSPGLFNTDSAHAYTALEGALGQLLGIDIRYHVMVNFGGFEKVVDTLGGAMIDVQIPVADYHYPVPYTNGGLKLYVAPGIQYMTGAQALAYARARHQTNDFDRSARQQRVIVSLREQTDVLSFLDPNKLDAVSSALRTAIHTDFPAEQLPSLISLIERVDVANLHSYVFTPPVYETQCPPAQCVIHYWLHPNVSTIQQAVRDAFRGDQALERSRQKLAGEDATVSVVDGAGTGQAGAVADYLDYLGVNAAVPAVNGGRADRSTYPTTVVTFYNGAEATMPETVRVLESTFGVKIQTKNDPSATVSATVVVGKATQVPQVPAR